MREIKFRAWDKQRREYLSGGQVLIAILQGKRPESNPIYLDVLQNADLYKNRFVLEQYTGLKDKNCVEIYEGDKLKCLDANGEYYFTEVYYNGGALAVDTNHRDYDYIAIGWAFNQGGIEEAEVIGNIHENADLLTKEE